MTGAFAEAALLAFLLAAGLTAGGVAALSVGRLLNETWVGPLHGLRGAARASPVAAVLAVPVLLLADRLYPWAVAEPSLGAWYRTDAFALRSLLVLGLWAALGAALARDGAGGRLAGGALVILVPTAAIMFDEWGASRDLGWHGSLLGIAVLVQATGAALALATLLALRRGLDLSNEARTGLERALLTLAAATLWLWFVQFVVVWAADLPPEAAWVLRRWEDPWRWLNPGFALPALLAAIALAVPPQWPRWRMAAVCALMVAAQGVHLVWGVRPDAALAPHGAGSGPTALDALAIAGVLTLLAVTWDVLGRGTRADVPAPAKEGAVNGR